MSDNHARRLLQSVPKVLNNFLQRVTTNFGFYTFKVRNLLKNTRDFNDSIESNHIQTDLEKVEPFDNTELSDRKLNRYLRVKHVYIVYNFIRSLMIFSDSVSVVVIYRDIYLVYIEL